jgi:hypothetical protein
MNQYKVRVRGQTYLWGSASTTEKLAAQVALTIHVDKFGEQIDLYKTAADDPPPQPGEKDALFSTLQPGGCLTVALNGLTGIFAFCALSTNVKCTLETTKE